MPETSYDGMTFPQAFASARKSGAAEFSWKGSRFTTQTAEEAAVKSGSAPEAEDFDEGEAPEPPKNDQLGNLLGAIDAIVMLDEKSPALPKALSDVAEEFQSALDEGRELFGQSQSPMADAYRHVKGSREAAKNVGVVPALAGGIGHEVANMVGALKGDLKQTGMKVKGQRLGNVAKNSLIDMANNLRGIISAIRQPEMSDEELMEMVSSGPMPPQEIL